MRRSALEASGWKREAGTAIRSDPQVMRFYTLLADRAAASGWLRLLFLHGQRPPHRDLVCVALSGSTVVLQDRLRPGVREVRAVQAADLLHDPATASADGLREVDFLGDAEPWKLEWTTTTRPHDWLFVFGNTMRSRLVHTAKCRSAPALKRWLRT